MSLSNLAKFVAGKENGCPITEVTSTQRNRAYVSTRQQHTPKLDRLSYLDFTPDIGTVRATPQIAQVWNAYQAFRRELPGQHYSLPPVECVWEA